MRILQSVDHAGSNDLKIQGLSSAVGSCWMRVRCMWMSAFIKCATLVICVMIHVGIELHNMLRPDCPGRLLPTRPADSFEICGLILRCRCAFRQVLVSGYNDVACWINRFVREWIRCSVVERVRSWQPTPYSTNVCLEVVFIQPLVLTCAVDICKLFEIHIVFQAARIFMLCRQKCMYKRWLLD